jgi:beta-mannanase
MIRKIIFVLLGGLVLVFGLYKLLQLKRAFSNDEFKEENLQQVLAVYYISANNITAHKDSMLHYNLKWVNRSENALPLKQLKLLAEKNKPLFLNLEVWPQQLIKNLDKKVPELILEHEYDDKFTALAKALAGFSQPVYLRYNPEMEVPLYKYPWQNQSGIQYILSFRYISNLCKKSAPNLKMIWGPAGYPGTEDYWPGAEFADYCSVTLNEKSDMPGDNFPPYKTAPEMIRRKLFRMRFFDKPVFLLSSPTISKNNFKQQWLDEVNGNIKADRSLYHSPLVPLDTDTSLVKEERDANLVIGAYDPKLKLVNQPLITTEHIFTDFKSVEDGLFKKNFDEVIARHHDVIVTFEPWKDKFRVKDSNLLVNTINGYYDKVIGQVYQVISNVPQTVYLRWGHEMEIPVDRYAWQKQDPVPYIKAFRYVATFQKPRASNIRIVWGPAGDRGSVEWWPGEDVVDYVSIAIYGLPDKNINDHTKQLTFDNIFKTKFHRMRFAHRPIFITEFGVKGPEDYKRKWLENAAWTINKYPEVKGLNYFNFADVPKAWGNAETPDWSITAATFKSFTGLLKDVPKTNQITAK